MTTPPRPPRLRVFLTNQAQFGDDPGEPVLCFLLNLSEEGACVSFPEGVAIPSHFSVLLEPMGEPHRAEVRWRSGNTVGVRFAGLLTSEARSRAAPHLIEPD